MYRLTPLLLLALLIAACDSNDFDAEVMVTGDHTAAFSPKATFQPDRDDVSMPYTTTDLRLTHFRADGTSHAISLNLYGALREGSFGFNTPNPSVRGTYTVYTDPEDLQTFEPRYGAVVVTRVSATSLEGTFRFNALERVAQGSPQQIEVSGRFSARRVQVP